MCHLSASDINPKDHCSTVNLVIRHSIHCRDFNNKHRSCQLLQLHRTGCQHIVAMLQNWGKLQGGHCLKVSGHQFGPGDTRMLVNQPIIKGNDLPFSRGRSVRSSACVFLDSLIPVPHGYLYPWSCERVMMDRGVSSIFLSSSIHSSIHSEKVMQSFHEKDCDEMHGPDA